MADEKKGGGGEGGGDSFYSNGFFWLLVIVVAWYVLKYLVGLIGLSFSGLPSLSSIFASVFGPIQVISIFLCLVFILGIIYSNFKLHQITHSHDHHGHGDHGHGGHGDAGHGHAAHARETHAEPAANVSNKRWENILARMASPNEADWRLAIIECDILLNEMLIKMGYRGESIADKLKLVEKSDFHTIEEAWEAHKTRNKIAHSGSEYHLSRSEAERTFNLYRRVFEEFYFV
ncbi:MAG TPA: hypothetical protein VEC13_02750 [Candidatus Paceibacterota bacterium]|nr:hypothetical protein [Candidatus Paceibacterota bacterium]